MPNSNIPNNYFEKLNKKVMKNIVDLEDNLNANAPLLSQINKNNFYTVPEGYFNLQNQILLNKFKRGNSTRKLYRFSVAAALLILLSASFWIINLQQTAETNESLAELNYINYLLENEQTIESEIIYALADESDITTELDFDDISDAELETYLSNIVEDIPLEELSIFEL